MNHRAAAPAGPTQPAPASPTFPLDDDALPAESWEGHTVAEWRTLWGLDTAAKLATDSGACCRGGAAAAVAAATLAPAGGPQLLIFSRASSTNTIARRLAEAGAPTGSIVIADEQTAGRGRAGRPWHAPPGAALLLSIILRPAAPLRADDAPGAIPLRIGLAAARAVDRIAGTNLRLKWPNDLQVESGGKVAGILCEASLAARGGGYVVAGIGLNVSQSAAEIAPAIAQPASSLRLATGLRLDRGALAGAIIAAVAQIGEQLTAPLDQAALAELGARDPLRGHYVTVDGEPAGEACGITPDGALIIRGPDGRITHLRNGTVRTNPRHRATDD
jgi:BirA family biotin operon repressor/biotin-[acetyl-CoA-carboxylase] ligase